MKDIFRWFKRLPKRLQDSVLFSVSLIGMVSTLFTILGVSLKDICNTTLEIRLGIVVVSMLLLTGAYYWIMGNVYKKAVTLTIAQTTIEILCGDIFKITGLKVIGCDNHFDTRVDDIVIAKNSLHGKLILEHGDAPEIEKLTEQKARDMKLKKNKEGLYDFPLGTIIKYESSIDGQTYLLVAVAELDEQYKVRTNMAEFEVMLLRMWKKIDRVYASYDVVFPILGDGMLRFDDGPKNKEVLLRCLLCTFNSSGMKLNSSIKIVIYENEYKTSLYEYKDILNTALWT